MIMCKTPTIMKMFLCFTNFTSKNLLSFYSFNL